MRRTIRIPAAILTALAMAACGGDGGGGATGSAPQVAAAPASRAVAVGTSVDFDVAAIGTAPLAYQWYRNGVAIPGAVSPRVTTRKTFLRPTPSGRSRRASSTPTSKA